MRDPGLASLRRATRAALVTPALFAFTDLVIGSAHLALFAAFGSFALLVFADFGGPSRPRAAAYAGATAVGAALVTLGTLASGDPWLAVAAMLLVGFIVEFAGVIEGYVLAAGTALLLSFVLAVSIEAPASDIGPRVGGWTLAGGVALLAALLLWPRYERAALREKAAEACQALAAFVTARWGHGYAERTDDARTARDAAVGHAPPGASAALGAAAAGAARRLRRTYRMTPHRPAGLMARDRAMARLVADLGFLGSFVSPSGPAEIDRREPLLGRDRSLGAAVADVLAASGRLLTGRRGRPDLAALDRLRTRHREELEEWAGSSMRAGAAPGEVLEGLQSERPLRVISYEAMAVGADAAVVAGSPIDSNALALPLGTPGSSGRGAELRRAGELLRACLSPSSVWFRNSLRAAIGLGLAVLLARLLRLDHAFWVVLGVVSVLRSNALATGRKAVLAITGTVVGFVLAALVMVAIGANTAALWAVLPVTVFLAAYAPTAVGFVVGQAAFTLFVVVLFNLLQPEGWRTGLVRVEDVAVGAAVSLLVGVLFWPRGARVQLRLALARLFRRNVEYVSAAFAGLGLGEGGGDAAAARRLVLIEAARTDDAFDQFLGERGGKPLPVDTWGGLVAGGEAVWRTGDFLTSLKSLGYRIERCRKGGLTAARLAAAVLDRLAGIGRDLESGRRTESAPRPVNSTASGSIDADMTAATLECLGEWGGAPDASMRNSAVGLVWVGDWIRRLDSVCDHLEKLAASVATATSIPWWR